MLSTFLYLKKQSETTTGPFAVSITYAIEDR